MIIVALAFALFVGKFFTETPYLLNDALAISYKISPLVLQKYIVFLDSGTIIGAILGGILNDRLGPGRVLIGTLIMAIVSLIVPLIHQDLVSLCVCRFIWGLVVGLTLNAVFSTLGRVFEGKKLNHASADIYTILFLTSAIDPLIVKFLLKQFSWQKIFFLLITVAIVALGLVIKYLKNISPGSTENYFQDVKEVLSRKGIIQMISCSMICMGGFYASVAIFKQLFQNHTSDFLDLGLIQSVGRGMTFASNFLLTKRILGIGVMSSLRAALIMQTLCFIALLSIVLINPQFLIESAFIVFVVICMISGFAQPISKAKLIEISKPLGGLSQTGASCAISLYSMVANFFLFWLPGGNGLVLFIYLTIALIFVTLLSILKLRNSKRVAKLQ